MLAEDGMRFLERVRTLPTLGLGVSTEFGAPDAPNALDILTLRREFPQFAQFLEVGVEVEKGLDRHALSWLEQALPTTYHFLDINLDEPHDFDAEWLEGVKALSTQIRPAWMCGDAGLWHFGSRDRGQLLLLPPVLCGVMADRMAEGVIRLREETGLEVLPENPPGTVFLGPLHLLDFYARLAEKADTGLLLDCAHLAIYQRMTGRNPLDALDGFPLDRVVEVHIAGGRLCERNGFKWVEDDHTPAILEDTWAIFERVLAGATNLKAVVFECERNPIEENLPAMRRIAEMWEGRKPVSEIVKRPMLEDVVEEGEARRLTQVQVEFLHDSKRAADFYSGKGSEGLTKNSVAMLRTVDPRAWSTDPYRRGRLLTALLDEYPVSASILGLTAMDSFFSSAQFRACISEHTSMSLSFGDWVLPKVGALAAIEVAVARSRRPKPVTTGWRLAPGVEPLEVPEGTLASWGHRRKELGTMVAEKLAKGLKMRAPQPSKKLEWLLVQPGADGPAIGLLSRTTYQLLEFLRLPRTEAAAFAQVRKLGADAGEEGKILADFLEDGMLTCS